MFCRFWRSPPRLQQALLAEASPPKALLLGRGTRSGDGLVHFGFLLRGTRVHALPHTMGFHDTYISVTYVSRRCCSFCLGAGADGCCVGEPVERPAAEDQRAYLQGQSMRGVKLPMLARR